MLSKEDNELLTRVGRGTPMGEMLRQYWLPALVSSDLPEPDGRPLRTRLLGEDLIAFRDTQGRPGLLANNCAHRGASLFFGRNKEGGLRCVYHGWKYDVAGNCIDMPNEPPDVGACHAVPLREKIHQTAYPCIERNGVIWTYMGPRAPVPPPLPDLEWNMAPADHTRISMALRECNWMQALEGDIDSSHIGFLHVRLNADDNPALGHYHTDKHPRLELVSTDCGLMYGARRVLVGGAHYWRVTHYLMPFHTFFPPRGYPWVPGHIWLPLDDHNTMVWNISYSLSGPLSEHDGAQWRPNPGRYLPPTSDALGKWRLTGNKPNDYQRDYEVQRAKTFSGIPTIDLQDQAMTAGMGSVFDHSQEHLGTTDAAIIQVRRRLLDAAKALRDSDMPPPGVDNPKWYGVRSASFVVEPEENWIEGSRDLLKAFSGLPVASAAETS